MNGDETKYNVLLAARREEDNKKSRSDAGDGNLECQTVKLSRIGMR